MVKKSLGMLKEAIKEKFTILKTWLWCFLMVLAVYGLAALVSMFFPKDQYQIAEFVQKDILNLLPFYIAALVYVMAAIFIYSFFKIIIFHVVQKKKIAKNSFNCLGSFYLLNLLICLIATIVFLAVGSAIAYAFSQSIAASTIYIIIFLLIVYPFVNFSQLVFMKENKIFRSIKKGFFGFFSRFGHYLRMIVTDIVYFAAVLLVFLIAGNIYRIIISKTTSIVYILAYNTIFTAAMTVLLFIIFSYNLYFFNKISRL